MTCKDCLYYEVCPLGLSVNGVTGTCLKFKNKADVVEVRHGEWVHCDGKSNLWYCSECGDKILYNPTRRTYNIRKRPVNEVNKYCRCCGAKMDGKGEGE